MKKIFFTLFVFILAFFACTESDLPNEQESVIKDSQNTIQTPFDLYLKREFTDTYNIEFIYRLIDIEKDQNYALVPANYTNSVRMANLVKYLCLEPYNKIAPANFLKKFFPKQIYLVGSPAYRNNGTFVLGTAEGGLKITLYNINNLDLTDINELNRFYFRTIYHEFSHILHQTKAYTIDYAKISESDYVGGSWNDTWSASNPSNAVGFISDYSSKEANEDFVEIIAHYLTNTPESWQQKIDDAGAVGGEIINSKLIIVKDYLKKTWELDIDALRDEIQERSANLANQDFDNIN